MIYAGPINHVITGVASTITIMVINGSSVLIYNLVQLIER